jgi:4-hydroxy-tetrahydrodipicolinate synthase
LLQALATACRGGDLATARRIQLDILPLCRVIYGEPNPGPLKLALKMAGCSAGPTRAPIYAPSAQTSALLYELLPPLLAAEREAQRGGHG